MNAFAADIRTLISQRLAKASPADMLALASAICATGTVWPLLKIPSIIPVLSMLKLERVPLGYPS